VRRRRVSRRLRNLEFESSDELTSDEVDAAAVSLQHTTNLSNKRRVIYSSDEDCDDELSSASTAVKPIRSPQSPAPVVADNSDDDDIDNNNNSKNDHIDNNNDDDDDDDDDDENDGDDDVEDKLRAQPLSSLVNKNLASATNNADANSSPARQSDVESSGNRLLIDLTAWSDDDDDSQMGDDDNDNGHDSIKTRARGSRLKRKRLSDNASTTTANNKNDNNNNNNNNHSDAKRTRVIDLAGNSEDDEAEENWVNVDDRGQECAYYLPRRLATVLRKHQHEGIAFLWQRLVVNAEELARRKRHEQKLPSSPSVSSVIGESGGVLAHAMGLGKSLTTFSLLVAVFRRTPSARFLLVVPKRAVDVWLGEYQRWRLHRVLPLYIVHTKEDLFVAVEQWRKTGGALLMSRSFYCIVVCPTKPTSTYARYIAEQAQRKHQHEQQRKQRQLLRQQVQQLATIVSQTNLTLGLAAANIQTQQQQLSDERKQLMQRQQSLAQQAATWKQSPPANQEQLQTLAQQMHQLRTEDSKWSQRRQALQEIYQQHQQKVALLQKQQEHLQQLQAQLQFSQQQQQQQQQPQHQLKQHQHTVLKDNNNNNSQPTGNTGQGVLQTVSSNSSTQLPTSTATPTIPTTTTTTTTTTISTPLDVFNPDDEKWQRVRALYEARSTLLTGTDIVVVDEGHSLKNEESRQTKALNRLATPRRLVLTGTPMQNRLSELYTLMEFVAPGALGTRKGFVAHFEDSLRAATADNATHEQAHQARLRTHALNEQLREHMHRVDDSVLQSTLPSRKEIVMHVRLTRLATALYNAQHIYMNSVSTKNNLFPSKLAAHRVKFFLYHYCFFFLVSLFDFHLFKFLFSVVISSSCVLFG